MSKLSGLPGAAPSFQAGTPTLGAEPGTGAAREACPSTVQGGLLPGLTVWMACQGLWNRPVPVSPPQWLPGSLPDLFSAKGDPRPVYGNSAATRLGQACSLLPDCQPELGWGGGCWHRHEERRLAHTASWWGSAKWIPVEVCSRCWYCPYGKPGQGNPEQLLIKWKRMLHSILFLQP